jgi:hypothetical protein
VEEEEKMEMYIIRATWKYIGNSRALFYFSGKKIDNT